MIPLYAGNNNPLIHLHWSTWNHRCTRVENPGWGTWSFCQGGQGLKEKLPGGSSYFGFHCIFINKFFENLPGGVLFHTPPSPLPPPPCVHLWKWKLQLFASRQKKISKKKIEGYSSCTIIVFNYYGLARNFNFSCRSISKIQIQHWKYLFKNLTSTIPLEIDGTFNYVWNLEM